MKQANTEFHKLYNDIVNMDDYSPLENRKNILKQVKDLFNHYSNIEEDLNDNGNYGIRYKTIHDDSRYPDTSEVFFLTEKDRDNVFEDWSNGLYWDNIFEQDLKYRTPGTNFHDAVKIVRIGKKIYVADEK